MGDIDLAQWLLTHISSDRLNGPLLGSSNQLDNFGEAGGDELAHGVHAGLFDSMSLY